MKWYKNSQPQTNQAWDIGCDLTARSLDHDYIVRTYPWRPERPDVYRLGGRACLPYVLHHAEPLPADNPEALGIIAQMPPAEEWYKLPFLEAYRELHPENCHPIGWQKPLR